MPITRRGVTEFTYSRFLVPYLCEFVGKAMFMDADMIVTGDVCELMDSYCVNDGAVGVVQDQPRFEWPSMMVFANARCRKLTPEFIEDKQNALFDFAWANGLGNLPKEWNHPVGYAEPGEAKLYHYTMGLPCWKETASYEPGPWNEAFQEANSTVSWQELMGNTVHAEKLRANGSV